MDRQDRANPEEWVKMKSMVTFGLRAEWTVTLLSFITAISPQSSVAIEGCTGEVSGGRQSCRCFIESKVHGRGKNLPFLAEPFAYVAFAARTYARNILAAEPREAVNLVAVEGDRVFRSTYSTRNRQLILLTDDVGSVVAYRLNDGENLRYKCMDRE